MLAVAAGRARHLDRPARAGVLRARRGHGRRSRGSCSPTGSGFAAVLGAGATAALVAVAVGLLARREGARDRYDSAHRARPRRRARARRDPRQRRLPLRRATSRRCCSAACCSIDSGDWRLRRRQRRDRARRRRCVLGPRWLATGFDPGAARALGAALGGARRRRCSRWSRSWRSPRSRPSARCWPRRCSSCRPRRRAWSARACVPGSSRPSRSPPLEGVAGLWLSVAAQRAARGGDRRARRRRLRASSRLGRVARRAAARVAGRGRSGGARAARRLRRRARRGGARPGRGRRDDDAARRLRARRRRRPASTVHQILQPNTDPHEYEPRPTDVRDDRRRRRRPRERRRARRLDGRGRRGLGRRRRGRRRRRARSGRAPGRERRPRASRYDPHWWHDPRNAEAAVVGDPRRADAGRPGRARRLRAQRRRLPRAAARASTAAIAPASTACPPAERKLVTDHDAFGYFAAPLRHPRRRRGHPVADDAGPAVGRRRRASSTRLIRREHVKAVFPESSLNPKLAKRHRAPDRRDRRPHALRRHARAEGLERRDLPGHGARQRRRDGARLHRRERGDARSQGI